MVAKTLGLPEFLNFCTDFYFLEEVFSLLIFKSKLYFYAECHIPNCREKKILQISAFIFFLLHSIFRKIQQINNLR